jgi:hypothetical protein
LDSAYDLACLKLRGEGEPNVLNFPGQRPLYNELILKLTDVDVAEFLRRIRLAARNKGALEDVLRPSPGEG